MLFSLDVEESCVGLVEGFVVYKDLGLMGGVRRV